MRNKSSCEEIHLDSKLNKIFNKFENKTGARLTKQQFIDGLPLAWTDARSLSVSPLQS
jgi:hypothetical protein